MNDPRLTLSIARELVVEHLALCLPGRCADCDDKVALLDALIAAAKDVRTLEVHEAGNDGA